MPKRAEPSSLTETKRQRTRGAVTNQRPAKHKSIPEWDTSIKRGFQTELMKLAEDGKRTKFEAMIAMAVEEASAGNVEMLKVILDRLEGKVAQAVDVSGTIQLGWAEMLKQAITVREVPLLEQPA